MRVLEREDRCVLESQLHRVEVYGYIRSRRGNRNTVKDNRVGRGAKFSASVVARAIQVINTKPLTTFLRLLAFTVFTPQIEAQSLVPARTRSDKAPGYPGTTAAQADSLYDKLPVHQPYGIE